MDSKEALRILNLKSGVCLEDAKKAYRALAKKYHPDIIGHSSDIQIDSEARMSDINLAFKSLAPHLKKRAEKSSPDPEANFKSDLTADSDTKRDPASPKKTENAKKTEKFSWVKVVKMWEHFFGKEHFNETKKSNSFTSSFKNETVSSKNKKQSPKKSPEFDEILRKISSSTTGEIRKPQKKDRPERSKPYNGYQKFMAMKKKLKTTQSNRSTDMRVEKIQKISPVKPVTRVR